MPLNRLIFFIFVLILVVCVIYVLYGPGTDSVSSVALGPKDYMERVQADRAAGPDPNRSAAPSLESTTEDAAGKPRPDTHDLSPTTKP
jgi:hypothetical protein